MKTKIKNSKFLEEKRQAGMRFFLFCALFGSALLAQAEETATTTPVQINVHLLESSDTVDEPSLTIIGHDELEKRQGETAESLLQSVAGLHVLSAGGAGQPTTVLIRGANSQETLVLIDGMEVNDPMNPSRGYDFSQLSLESMERIEIYRGPQSVRFGDGAVGGVINFVTKKGQGPLQGSALLEGGAYQTAQAMTQVSGRDKRLSYSLCARVFTTQGFSAADERDGATEADGQHLSSVSARLGWAFDANNEIESTVRSTRTKMDLDRSGGPTGDDPNYAGEMNQLAANMKYRRLSLNAKLDSLVLLSWAEFSRADRNDPDATSATFSWDKFLSEARKLEINNEYFFTGEESLRLGIQLADESGGSTNFSSGTTTDFPRKYQSIYGASLIARSKARPFFYEIGAREDQQRQFGSVFSYSVAPGYEIVPTGTTFRVSASSAFKGPSLYQLYSSFGDPSLSVEKARAWEASVEQSFWEKSALSLTYFENQYENLIDFDPVVSKYQNIGEAWSKGIEIQARFSLHENYFLTVGENYLLSKDKSTGQALLRRPKNSVNIGLAYQNRKWDADLRYRYVGAREDQDPVSFNRVEMPFYQVVDMQAGYRLQKDLKLRARIDNLFNAKYEEVDGYGTSGAALYLGLLGEI